MKARNSLLIVDDEANIRRILQVAFEKAGYITEVAANGLDAIAMAKSKPFDCVLTDVTMPGMNGYQLLKELTSFAPSVPIVMMTAYGTIPQAIQAIRDGAHEYITKPFDLDHLKKVIAGAVKEGNGSGVGCADRSVRSSGKSPGISIVAESSEMKEILATVDQVAVSKATVMIGGESGVGKEVIAKRFHEKSGRTGPFIAVSCAALPEALLESELFGHEKGAFTGASTEKLGRFEAASHGTLFLDEVGEIPLSVQVKLLRALQERTIERLGSSSPIGVDVRVITATHQNLHALVEAGQFRLDLLYRLQVVEIEIPPLRQRKADIEPLVHAFLKKFCAENRRAELKISDEVLRTLEQYPWPGNVRELENAIERSVVLASADQEVLLLRNLPKALQSIAA